ncbi:MAG: hypothetical protein ACRDKC_03805 [Gaiellaceae bacterium]
MGLFRRKGETLNERLLREGGLDPGQFLGATAAAEVTEPTERGHPPPLALLNLHGTKVDPKAWDTIVTVTASGLEGDRIEFTTLPDGDVIVGDEQGDADLSVLADAVEDQLPPPYRAVAARQKGDMWAVGAKRIEVARIPFDRGTSLELSRKDSRDELRVDGEESDAMPPAALEQIGERAGSDFFVEGERIDGDFWEVRSTAL